MIYAADLRRCKSFPKHIVFIFKNWPVSESQTLCLCRGVPAARLCKCGCARGLALSSAIMQTLFFFSKQLKDPELYDAAQPLGLSDAFEAEINKVSGQGQSGGLPPGKMEGAQREDALSSPDAASRLPGIKF